MSNVETASALAESNVTSKLAIFKNRNFLFLFISALFSSPGYYVYLMGNEWLMLTITENRFYFGMLFFAASIPRLLFLTTGGLIADRFNKRTIVFLSDLSRAVLILILVILIFTDTVMVWHLITLAAFFGVSDAFSHPSLSSLPPTLLEDKQLQQGNSLIQMTNQLSPIVGPAIGGGLIVLIGFEGVFTVSLVMLLIATIAIIQVRISNSKDEVNEGSSMLKEFKEGIQYAKQNRLIISIMTIALFLNLCLTGPATIGIPIIVKDIFQENALGLTIMEASIGIGSLLGAIFLSIKGDFKKPGIVLIVSLMMLGLLYMFTGFAIHLALNAILLFFIGFIIQLINIPIVTMLQRTTEKKMLGRMMSLLMTASTGLVPVSYVITSILIAAGINIQYIILVGGALVAIIGLLNMKNNKIINYQ